MNNILIAIAGVIALVAGLSWATRTKEPVFAANFESSCIEAIKERLRAPSTFRLVETVHVTDRPFTMEWWSEHQTDDLLKSDDAEQRDLGAQLKDIAERQVSSGYMIATSVITYDAHNSYGTPLRGQALCELPYAPEKEEFKDRDIRIDGKTNFQWMLSRL